MDVKNFSQDIKKVLDTAKSCFVLIPENANLDATATALSLYLALKESGKNVLIGSPSQMRVEQSKLVGIDKISNQIGNRNLVIAFDYQEESIEKVSYNVEGNKFNLVIQPRSGYPPLNKENIAFSYEGMDAELIFVIGATKLESLGSLYEKNRQAFRDATVVNIDRTTMNTKFGQINVVDPKTASICELAYFLIKDLQLSLNADIAGNLLKGIEAQTQNFQSPMASVETFEVSAELMRAGAKRSPAPITRSSFMSSPQRPSQFPAFRMPVSQQPAPFPSTLNEPSLQVDRPSMPSAGINMNPFSRTQDLTGSFQDDSYSQAQDQQTIVQKTEAADDRNKKPEGSGNGQQQAEEKTTEKDELKINNQNQEQTQSSDPKEEWLQTPKIYRGKTKVK